MTTKCKLESCTGCRDRERNPWRTNQTGDIGVRPGVDSEVPVLILPFDRRTMVMQDVSVRED